MHTALISVKPGGRMRSPAIATSAPVVADADVAAEVDRTRPPRPRLGAATSAVISGTSAGPSATCSGTGPGGISPSSTICTQPSSNVFVQPSGIATGSRMRNAGLARTDERAQRVPVVRVGRVGQRAEDGHLGLVATGARLGLREGGMRSAEGVPHRVREGIRAPSRVLPPREVPRRR